MTVTDDDLLIRSTRINYDLGLEGEERSLTRNWSTQVISNGYDFLLNLSYEKEGGGFFGCSDGTAIYPLKSHQKYSTQVVTEIDDLPHDKQLEIYQRFGEVSKLTPYLISSGGKSVHGHLLLNQHTPIDKVVYLRRLLCLIVDGDPAVTRPHQPFRLPTFYRKEKGIYQAILQESDNYSYERILEGFKACFDELGYIFPTEIDDRYWTYLTSILQSDKGNKGRKKEAVTKEEKLKVLKEALATGQNGFYESLKKTQKERIATAKNYQLNQDNLSNSDKEKLILELLQYILSKTIGDGLYEDYRSLFCAVKNELGLEKAIQIAEAHSPAKTKWRQVLTSSHGNFTIGTIYHYAKIWGGYSPSNSEYGKVILSGQETLDQANESINEFDFTQWKKDELTKLTKFTPDKTLKCKFIGELLYFKDFEGKITAIRAPKGSGKSSFLSTLKRFLKRLGIPLLLLFDRNKLKHKLADELAINVIDDSLSNDLIETLVNVREDIAATIDSLPRLKKYDLSGYFIIIDEAEQVTDSLGISETHIKSVRGMAWGVLDRAIKGSKGVLIQDADLSDKTVNYWAKLAPHLAVEKIENVAKPTAKNLYLYSSQNASKRENKGYLNLMFNELDKKLKGEGEVMFCVDSETQGNAIYHQYKDKYKTVYLSSKTIGNNPQLNKYTENKGKQIKEDNIQLLIVTPVLQSGFSIEIDNYFDAVFGYFLGVTTSNISRQMLMRYRGDCDRFVWCAKYGLKYKSFYNFNTIKEKLIDAEFITNSIQYLQQVEKLTTLQATVRIAEILQGQNLPLNVNLDNVAMSQARVNLDKSMLLSNFIEGAENEGYIVEYPSTIDYEGNINLLKSLATLSEQSLTKEAHRISMSPLIDKWTYERLSRKATLTDDERAKLARYIIAQRLPDLPLKTEFIKAYILKDRYKVINGIQNYYFSQNFEVAKTIDFNSLTSRVRQAENGGFFYGGDLKNYTKLALLWHELKLEDIRSNGFTNFTSKDFIRTITPKLRYILKTQGISYSANTSPTTVLSKILGLFGFGIQKVKKSGDLREYKVINKELVSNELNWTAIYSSINTRFSADLNLEKDFYSEMGDFYGNDHQSHTEHSSDSGHHAQFYIKKKDNGVHTSSEDIVMDTGEKIETSPPPLPSNKKNKNNQELLGKKCNFWDNNKQWVQGFITEILDFGIQLKDSHNNVSYCDLSQIEILEELVK
ncbi:hypothetical protein GM3708_3619 (plasmid) [Geminocystis sp. NIES-3708]|nr:hypothetical protein GM3708_3619 [Geminocystis sp. NIES-3708]